MVVSKAMLEAAANVQPFADSANDATRVWQLFANPDVVQVALGAAIQSALDQMEAEA